MRLGLGSGSNGPAQVFPFADQPSLARLKGGGCKRVLDSTEYAVLTGAINADL